MHFMAETRTAHLVLEELERERQIKQSDVCGYIVAACCRLILQGFHSTTTQQRYSGAAPVQTEAADLTTCVLLQSDGCSNFMN